MCVGGEVESCVGNGPKTMSKLPHLGGPLDPKRRHVLRAVLVGGLHGGALFFHLTVPRELGFLGCLNFGLDSREIGGWWGVHRVKTSQFGKEPKWR